MERLLDLGAVAAAIEHRRPRWTEAGADVGPLTWRVAGTWPAEILEGRPAVGDADSVGVFFRRGDAHAAAIVFMGGWADVEC